jgi:hypothetical protein
VKAVATAAITIVSWLPLLLPLKRGCPLLLLLLLCWCYRRQIGVSTTATIKAQSEIQKITQK